jgi:hypothetical protein
MKVQTKKNIPVPKYIHLSILSCWQLTNSHIWRFWIGMITLLKKVDGLSKILRQLNTAGKEAKGEG